MATYIKTLKEDNGDITYPQTKASAVLLTNNSDLETEMAKYVTAEEIASTSAIDYSEILSRIYPVGSIYMSATMSTAAQVEAALGGTWVAWGAGRVPVGIGVVEANNDDWCGHTSAGDWTANPGSMGGETYHQLTVSEMPSHTHNRLAQWGSGTSREQVYFSGSYQGQAYFPTTSTGGDAAHNNMMPYITCYMYKRTA